MPGSRVGPAGSRGGSIGANDQVWIVAVLFAFIGLLFTIIAVAAPGWYGGTLLKNCSNYCVSTAVMSFIAIFLIFMGILCMVLFAKQLITSVSGGIKASSVILLTLGGIFIVAAYGSYGRHEPRFYSYHLLIAAGVFTFVSSIIASFWLGQNWR